MNGNQKLSRLLLERTLKDHRPLWFWMPGVVNPLAAKFAGEVSLLLGFQDLAAKFRVIAERRPKNVEIPDEKMWAAFSTIRDSDTIEKEYPIIDQAYLETHVDHSHDGNYQAALENAKTDYDKECLLITQIMNGQVQSALTQSDKLTDDRKWNVYFIATMESFRNGDTETGERLLKKLPRRTMCLWSKPQMALVISGRAGWGGYPYPDY